MSCPVLGFSRRETNDCHLRSAIIRSWHFALRATSLSRHQSAFGGRRSTPLASEDAQKHRPATTAAIFTFWIILRVAGHMLPSTAAVISITVAGASAMSLRISQLGATTFQYRPAPQCKSLSAADRAGVAAQEGHFRARHFADLFVLPQRAAPASTEPGAERVPRLSPWLVFAYAADGLLELITSKQYVAARLEPCG